MNKPIMAIMAVLLTACANPPAPRPAPEPDAEMARISGESLAHLQHGRMIYQTKCNRCHVPMLPDQISEGDWHVVVPGMAWNAGITKADEEAVLAYILAAKQMP